MPDDFISGPDWQCSSGPYQPEAYDASDDLWPHGAGSEIGGGAKDVLADGLHPVLAVGPKANRPHNLTGVVMTYNATLDRAIMNMAEKVCVKQYVANVLTYSGGNPATYQTSMTIGAPVYVDDSDGLASGVTLSLSPLNSADSANPLAGYLWYCQDEYDDSGIGGAAASASWPKTVANSLVQAEYCVILTNDYGTADLDAYLATL